MPDDDPLPAHRQEVVIGALGPGRVAIIDHNASWWGQFGAHARGVRDALGAAAIRIEHIGSTSIPGLAAKPVIDILSTCPPWSPEVARSLRLREHLRERPGARARYDAHKRDWPPARGRPWTTTRGPKRRSSRPSSSRRAPASSHRTMRDVRDARFHEGGATDPCHRRARDVRLAPTRCRTVHPVVDPDVDRGEGRAGSAGRMTLPIDRAVPRHGRSRPSSASSVSR